MPILKRPDPEHCPCAADRGDNKKSWTFVRDRGNRFYGCWVHGDCGLPSRAYLEAAYEAGIL